MKWHQLTDTKQIQDIVKESEGKKVLIFKHSTRCGISSMALHELEMAWQTEGGLPENKMKPYFLDLLSYRSVSNQVAEHFGITHKSPQALLIDKGECVYTSSHGAISFRDIQKRTL